MNSGRNARVTAKVIFGNKIMRHNFHSVFLHPPSSHSMADHNADFPSYMRNIKNVYDDPDVRIVIAVTVVWIAWIFFTFGLFIQSGYGVRFVVMWVIGMVLYIGINVWRFNEMRKKHIANIIFKRIRRATHGD